MLVRRKLEANAVATFLVQESSGKMRVLFMFNAGKSYTVKVWTRPRTSHLLLAIRCAKLDCTVRHAKIHSNWSLPTSHRTLGSLVGS